MKPARPSMIAAPASHPLGSARQAYPDRPLLSFLPEASASNARNAELAISVANAVGFPICRAEEQSGFDPRKEVP